MVVSPVSFEDLRNVFLFDGKAQVRAGLTERSVLHDATPADLDVTVMLAPMRSIQRAIGVGYNTTGGTNREVWVNRLDIDGTNPVDLGLLGTLISTAAFTPPIIIGADSDSRFFLAHDEPLLPARFKTQFYDPLTSPALNDLQADLDGNGLADVFFRGVVRHLSYIFGWGFGSATDPVRDDVVRVSKSGNSSVFEDFGFFEAGQQGEPVMVCRSAGRNLMVFKETETHAIFGYSPDTFGILPSDTLWGCVSSRLAVTVGGTVFFWSTQGPRMTTGGESLDIASPLDIEGPDPATLAAESEVQDAFAEYDPANRVVNFVWGQRVYALSIRDPSRPRWSYYELGETVQCGGQFFTTQSAAGSGGAPTGAPENLTFPTSVTDATSVDILFDNVSQTGGEIVEVWVSKDGGTTYKLVLEEAANDLATQQVTVDFEQLGPNLSIQPLTDYKFSLRYRRGIFYAPGYTDPDPDLWDTPAFDSQGTTTTVSVAPTFVTRAGNNNGIWSRESAGSIQIILGIVIPPGHELMDLEIDRSIIREGNVGTSLDTGNGIGSADSGTELISGFALLATQTPVAAAFTDTGPTAQRFNDYRARFVNGANQGAYGATLRTWAGPDAPQGDSLMCTDEGFGIGSAQWQNATTPPDARTCPPQPPASHSTEIWLNNHTNTPLTGWVLDDTKSPFTSAEIGLTFSSTPADEMRVAVRHKVSCFSQIEYSAWSIVSATPNYCPAVIA